MTCWRRPGWMVAGRRMCPIRIAGCRRTWCCARSSCRPEPRCVRGWDAAVRSLDFPERFINKGYNTTFTKLRANGRFDELASGVKRIANQHAGGGLIDYTQRRATLANWDGIDIESWHLLQPRPRPLYPHRRVDMPVRRAQASLWLWCHLTSGHEHAAPISMPTARGLSDQTQFMRDALPTLRERLLILGELLLTTPAEARSTLLNRLAAALHHRGYLAENYYLDTGVDIPKPHHPLRRIARTARRHPGTTARRPPPPTHRACLLGTPSPPASAATPTTSATTTGATRQHSTATQISLPNSNGSPERSSTGKARRRPTRPHPTASACTTSRSRSKATPPSCSPPPTGKMWRGSPASPSAASTPTSPATTQAHQRQAGYAHANLKRGLTTTPRTRLGPAAGSNYVSHGQLR